MIPNKPENVTWTDAQWQAIWAKGQDTLVSAAAGSGKTAVLINRMIEKVIDAENPIDVDELLVVTFTNASAAEMRQRMAKALEMAIEKNPNSRHLRRQLSLINKAQISTLHSFCLNIIRQYSYLLDMDPGFRIANDTEAALLRDDMMAEVLEEAYAKEDHADVYRLMDAFTSDRDDQAIEVLIAQLYSMARVNPEPIKWLNNLPKNYDLKDIKTVDELPLTTTIKQAILHSIEGAIQLIQDMRHLTLQPNGPDALGATAQADLEQLVVARTLITHDDWQAAYTFFQGFKWGRLASQKKDSCDEQLKDLAKNKRDQAKKLMTDSISVYFQRPPEKLLEEITNMKPIIETLVTITHAFSDKYAEAKAEKGLIDFSDLEHFALAILTEDQEGELVPSSVAIDYQQHFAEVLVDEYQDTNKLQETILQLIKSGDSHDGNMFMVGDVKQSIYRFRLAEPTLFLNKYLAYSNASQEGGLKIDLNANFRSRHEVLDGTNYIFKQIMGKAVGEIDYDEAASLKAGAPYPQQHTPITLAILHSESEEEAESTPAEADVEEQELKKSQQEARYIIAQIRHLLSSEQLVYDAFKKEANGEAMSRPIEYRDIVILMRSMTWSGDFVEEFKLAGIPLYAELSKGYFDAIEVMIMMNTLKIIDNPYQDIPLASVLRSPFIGMTENDLANIRLADKKAPFYDALKLFVHEERALQSDVAEKLQRFLIMLEDWRDLARRGSLAELIWQVYIDTNYYEMVGAMINGKQRQANLRALHDRAISYEKTSFRGLFRFLRFIERMQLRGDDLGTAKAVGQSENVVRIMTIHASKGLEFPYVFAAGLGRDFNRMDFNRPYLFDSDFGLAVKMVDPEKRIQYTSLPFLAMKEKKMLELKAEEMRVLYVAMTRAKEKLYLVGTVKNWQKSQEKWEEAQLLGIGETLPEFQRAKATNYLDWLGPAIARHPDYYTEDGEEVNLGTERSRWKLEIIDTAVFTTAAQLIESTEQEVTAAENEEFSQHLKNRLNYQYPYQASVEKKSKTSVSEMKRLQLLAEIEEPQFMISPIASNAQKIAKRPMFLQKATLTSAEKGTAMHAAMQHIPQAGFADIAEIELFVQQLIDQQLITEREGQSINTQDILAFLDSEIGQQFKIASQLHREMPFTMSFKDADGDVQIVQGIVDCLYEQPNGQWTLVDYKTDQITATMLSDEGLKKEMVTRYGIQLDTYKKALENIMHITIDHCVIYAFDANKWLEL
ncbi:ATP-dependent helicase/nuclease subunit A [Kurthia sibirica]|uniref:ATP-dependent helicase/nuclease subunit A n=2 Tax=Kurthia sibirica TaxID=202750 RepID=A0A2U3AMW0_9BACL|nr:helicase-exonuclease AddAB subunit AddA [Kurthia sibirica]GEK33648.1 ATP-dependent helicase/nuclease subunit A [Kurthia sibirica]